MARIKLHLIFSLSLLLYWTINKNQTQADSSHFFYSLNYLDYFTHIYMYDLKNNHNIFNFYIDKTNLFLYNLYCNYFLVFILTKQIYFYYIWFICLNNRKEMIL